MAIPVTAVVSTATPLWASFSAKNPREINPVIMARADQDKNGGDPCLRDICYVP